MALFRLFANRLKGLLAAGRKSNGTGLDSEIDIHRFESIIGHQIHSPHLFVEALLHRSYLQYQDLRNKKSNERLEFLGDSILNLIVGEYLYSRYPEAEEGELTKLRSRLVSRKALAVYARQLKLEEFMFLSSSAAQSLEKGSDSMLADAYEAVIAAIYLDAGFEAARKFVERQVLAAITSGILDTADQNYKSLLLEYAQAHGLGIPRYVILKEEGPDHDRTFTVEVMVSDKPCGIGTGKNKKEAEQSAAMMALERVHNLDFTPSART
jgi:ribonuclease-3